MLTDGLHPLVSAVLRSNKMVVVAGLAADVRLACDHLMKRSSTPLQIHHIDHWTAGRADNKPYRFARSSIEILTTYKLEFEVHHASPTSAPQTPVMLLRILVASPPWWVGRRGCTAF